MNQVADAHCTTVTVDSLVAAFQHFNITHVTASEFFRFVEAKCEGPPALGRGAVLPLYGRPPSQSEIAELTKDLPTRSPSHEVVDPEVSRRLLEEVMCHPVLPWWMDAATRLELLKTCKEQMGDRYEGPAID